MLESVAEFNALCEKVRGTFPTDLIQKARRARKTNLAKMPREKYLEQRKAVLESIRRNSK